MKDVDSFGINSINKSYINQLGEVFETSVIIWNEVASAHWWYRGNCRANIYDMQWTATRIAMTWLEVRSRNYWRGPHCHSHYMNYHYKPQLRFNVYTFKCECYWTLYVRLYFQSTSAPNLNHSHFNHTIQLLASYI